MKRTPMTTLRAQAGWLRVLTMVAAFLVGAGAMAEDRSVTIIEGVPEPVPEAPLPPGFSLPAADLKADNPAHVTLDILPNQDLQVGTEIAFRIGAAKPGYLVLVDINAEGHIAQIYPNVASLAHYAGTATSTNLIRPGTIVRVPDLRNPLASFTFRAQTPRGGGVMLAVLSENPVQIIDLPEATAITDPQAAVDVVGAAIRTLRLTQAGGPGRFAPGVWSIAAKAYVIR